MRIVRKKLFDWWHTWSLPILIVIGGIIRAEFCNASNVLLTSFSDNSIEITSLNENVEAITATCIPIPIQSQNIELFNWRWKVSSRYFNVKHKISNDQSIWN